MDDVDIIRFPQVLTRVQHTARLKELHKEFETPPIPDDRKERLQNAIVYVQDRKWSLRKAAEKAGVDRSAVRRLSHYFSLCFFHLAYFLAIFFHFVEL